MIESVRDVERNVLLVDAGDVFGSDENDIHWQAETMIEGMTLMGYDALNLGTSELGLGRQFLDELQREAGFPFLSANVVNRDSLEPAYTSYVVKKTDLLQVGIIGLTSPTWGSAEESLQTRDPVVVLNTLLPQVQKQAHIIVVLAHLPYQEAVALLNYVEGVDVMIVAPQGELPSAVTEVNGALVVGSGRHGTDVHKLRIVANIEGRILDYSMEAMTLDESVGQDARLVDLVEQAGRP